MALTYFHDGRILIVTMAGATSQPAEAPALCAAVRADLQARRAPVLVDARAFTSPWLIECVDRLVAGLDRAPRFAILLSSERCAEERAALRLLAAEHGAEVVPFDNLGLALRWLWWLDSPISLPLGLRVRASLTPTRPAAAVPERSPRES